MRSHIRRDGLEHLYWEGRPRSSGLPVRVESSPPPNVVSWTGVASLWGIDGAPLHEFQRCSGHRSLRQSLRVTPAMEAGIAAHVWSKEIAGLKNKNDPAPKKPSTRFDRAGYDNSGHLRRFAFSHISRSAA